MKKEKPWEKRRAVLPWFRVYLSCANFLRTLSRGKRPEKADKPKEKAKIGRAKQH